MLSDLYNTLPTKGAALFWLLYGVGISFIKMWTPFRHRPSIEQVQPDCDLDSFCKLIRQRTGRQACKLKGNQQPQPRRGNRAGETSTQKTKTDTLYRVLRLWLRQQMPPTRHWYREHPQVFLYFCVKYRYANFLGNVIAWTWTSQETPSRWSFSFQRAVSEL